jgi:hypothetical protein
MIEFKPRYFVLPAIAMTVLAMLHAPADSGAPRRRLLGADPRSRHPGELRRVRARSSREPPRRAALLTPTICAEAPINRNRRRGTMRFMVIVKATKDSEAGKMPSEEMLGAMAKFNEEMVKAGIMLDGAGLQSSAKGARIRFEGGKRTVIDGPFAETKELIAGYWIIQVKNKAEAIEWMKRCPNPYNEDGEIEMRQFFELEDFGESPAVDHHKAVGEQMAAQKK